jgi:hypothetical protein
MTTSALYALLALEFPQGERDALHATAQHRVLAERLQAAATGRLWAAPRPSWEMTFTQGPVGWVAHAVPFVVHESPELLALGGEAFTDGANLWIHGPWLQTQAAHVANDAQALVDWAHLAIGDIAEMAQGRRPTDPLVPLVDPRRVSQVLAPKDTTQQPIANRWHTPGDTRAIHQALQWAQRFDTGFAASGLPVSTGVAGLPTMPAPTPWKAWATLMAKHLPENDGFPVLPQNQVTPEDMDSAQRILWARWSRNNEACPLIQQLSEPLKEEGLLNEATLGLMAHTLQALALGTLSCAPTRFEDIPTARRLLLGFTTNRQSVGSIGLEQWMVVHPRTRRPEVSTVPSPTWRQACIWAALKEGTGLESPQAQGTPTSSPWLFELNAWKTLEHGRRDSATLPPEQEQLAASLLLDAWAEAQLPITYCPTMTDQGIALEPRTPEQTLADSASRGQLFRSLMTAPVFSNTSHQTPDSLLTGLTAEGLSYLERPDAEAAYHFLQSQMQERQWEHTEGREQLALALLTGYMEGRYGMPLEKLWVTKQRFEEQLGLTAEHWLPALLSHSQRLRVWDMMGMLEEEVHAFFRSGSDLDRVRSSLGKSIHDWILTHPDAPNMGALTNVLRHHRIDQALPVPSTNHKRSGPRF